METLWTPTPTQVLLTPFRKIIFNTVQLMTYMCYIDAHYERQEGQYLHHESEIALL